MAMDMDYIKNCVFVDESAFDINMRTSCGRPIRNTSAVVMTPLTKAKSHTILRIISSVGTIRVAQMRKKVKTSEIRKRKITSTKTKSNKMETRTGYYLEFLRGTLNQLDNFQEMKGVYLIMDNALIHTHEEINSLISSRGYRCIYLPLYSPELSHIKRFWTIVKNRVKRSQFDATEEFHVRIAEACNSVPGNTLQSCIHHSVIVFSKCLNKEPV